MSDSFVSQVLKQKVRHPKVERILARLMVPRTKKVEAFGPDPMKSLRRPRRAAANGAVEVG